MPATSASAALCLRVAFCAALLGAGCSSTTPPTSDGQLGDGGLALEGGAGDSAATDATRPPDHRSSDALLCGAAPCDDGLSCTDDVCDQGSCKHPLKAAFCLIDGACHAAGSGPSGSCRRCEPKSSTVAWAEDAAFCPDDGVSCTEATCTAGQCGVRLRPGFCLVGGVCIKDGERDPANECQFCDVGTATSSLQVAKDGTACAADALGCTDDVCSAGKCQHPLQRTACLIDGACYAQGEVNPLSDCQGCDARASQTAWSLRPNGGACTDDGRACTDDVCQTGSCTHPVAAGSCLIGGSCFKNGDTNPAAECQRCDPGQAATAWSRKADGTACTADALTCTDDVCGAGSCTHPLRAAQCLIGGACYAADTPQPGVDCRSCRPALSTNAWSSAQDGAACSADGLTCTDDRCTAGSCVHPLRSGNCLIGGTCYAEEVPVAGNACTLCVPAQSTSASTFVEGMQCSDGDSLTSLDMCLAGSCRGLRAFQWEWYSSDTATSLSRVGVLPGGTTWVVGRYADGAVTRGMLGRLNRAATPSALIDAAAPLSGVHHRTAVGDSGQVFFHNGSTWNAAGGASSHLGTARVNAVWGASVGGTETFYLAADGGRIARCTTPDNGLSFTCADGTGMSGAANLVGVFGTLSGSTQGPLWAIRGNTYEDIYHQTGVGAAWGLSPPGGCSDASGTPCSNTSGRLLDLWAGGANEAWVVGEQGLVLRYDGSGWTRVSIPSLANPGQSSYTFRGVYGHGDLRILVGERDDNGQYLDLVAVAYNHKLARWFPPRVALYTTYADPNKASYRFNDVGGPSLSELYVVGSIWSSSAAEQRALFLAMP